MTTFPAYEAQSARHDSQRAAHAADRARKHTEALAYRDFAKLCVMFGISSYIELYREHREIREARGL